MENLFSEGFIQVGRKLFKEHYWEEATPEQKVIFLTLLSLAVYEPKVWDAYGKKITLQPGQFIKTLPKLQQDCGRGITLSQIKTALHLFAVAVWVTSEPVSRSPKSGKLFTVAAALRVGLSTNELEQQRLRKGCDAEGFPF